MQSLEDLLDRADSFTSTETQEIPSWLTIPTTDRQFEVERAIASYADHFSRFGHRLKMLISDDSKPGQRGRTQQTSVRPENGNREQPICYAGLEERRELLGLLTKEGDIPPDIVGFGLLGHWAGAPTFGANRNTILLLTAGETLLSVDDDTVCHPCVPREAKIKNTLRLDGESDPTECWFHPDRESLLGSLQPFEIDVARAHGAFLGKPVWSIFKSAASKHDLDLQTVSGRVIDSIWSGRGSVPITLNGSAGDSGASWIGNLRFHRSPATRKRLFASEQAYGSALRSREVVRQTLAATVCHTAPFMGMFVGMDNRSLLPPFFPLFRNEDGCFGAVLARFHEDCFAVHLPWSMLHVPPPGRTYSQESGNPVRMADLVMLCVSTWRRACCGIGVSRALQSLGRHLTDMASTEPRDFREAVRALVLQRAARRISRLFSLRECSGPESALLSIELERDLNAAEREAAEPDYGAPIDLMRHVSRDEAWQTAQSLVRRYGELLAWWPAIVQRAKELRSADKVALVRTAVHSSSSSTAT